MVYSELRDQYPLFSYDSFSVSDNGNGIRIDYSFTQGNGISFKPYWIMPFTYNDYKKDKDFFDLLAFNLGMAEAVSYWKACCSPVFSVKCGSLSKKQIRFWKKLYFNGLGEFFYRNGIDADEKTFIDISASENFVQKPKKKFFTGNLIPIGGGKDSIVTLELLKAHHNENKPFIIEANGARTDTAKTAGYTDGDIVYAQRGFDRSIVELNKAGYLNGHTPLSAVIAFSAFFCAYAAGLKYIVLSNESSANESYVYGKNVNHQYSKSFEFENDFRSYALEFLSPDIEYYSLLRPLNEWNIVKRFVTHPQYFDVFRSCNLGAKDNIWCGKCSKCLFTCIMLSAFIDRDELMGIFGADLLNDPDMLKFLDGLVTETEDKPFECIGTRPEINAALTAAVKKYGDELPLILKTYKEKYYDPDFNFADVEDYYDSNNNVPQQIKKEMGWI